MIGCGIKNDESNEHVSNSQHTESDSNEKEIDKDKITKKCFNMLSKDNAQYSTVAQYYVKQVYGFDSIVLNSFEDGFDNLG